MARVVIVGDGPGGLSAALFLAKNGQETIVYGEDQTAMHFAYLYNYLGVPAISGTDFQHVARQQAEAQGAELRQQHVVAVAASGETYAVTDDEGTTTQADFVILTEGKNPELAKSLGLRETPDGIEHDTEYRSSLDRVYVLGRAARRNRSQAIISAGAGATAALDILSRLAGKDVTDWDTPPDDD